MFAYRASAVAHVAALLLAGGAVSTCAVARKTPASHPARPPQADADARRGAVPASRAPLTARTEEAELALRGFNPMPLSAAGEFERLVGSLSSNPRFVTINKKPETLSAKARFGVVSLGYPIVGLAIDGDDERGYTLFLDANANGDLADDTSIALMKDETGYAATIRASGRDSSDRDSSSFPLIFKLALRHETLPGATEPREILARFGETIRRGKIRVGERDVAFALLCSEGVYNEDYCRVFFDLSGDGSLDTRDDLSSECYRISEEIVNIGEWSYRFGVDRHGSELTLTPLPEKRLDRPSLDVGREAPDFTFRDLDGSTHKLSDYRGRVVILDFWGTWCAPCVFEAPKLAEGYRRLVGRGIVILGVHKGETEEIVRKFVTERGMPWPEAIEPEDGPILRLYRVNAYPTHFLIGRDRRILSHDAPLLELFAQAEKALAE